MNAPKITGLLFLSQLLQPCRKKPPFPPPVYTRSTFGQDVILSSGSGLIINHTGVIVTNAHVVNIAATVPWRTELRVQLQNSEVYVGIVRDVDWKTDIATVKVNPQVEATGTFQFCSRLCFRHSKVCRWRPLSRSLTT